MIEVQIKLSYVQNKNMKKLYGRMIGREIAIGRKLLKMIKGKYEQ